MIAQNELKNLLHYEPETGIFRWNVPNRGHAKEGDMAGTRTGRYAYITINGQPYLAHRLAWFYVHGEWPKHNIDHVDRNSRNNAISNLRDVPQSVNMQNMIVDGASFDKRRKRWISQIVAFGRRRNLGSYDSVEEAREAYRAAKRVLHPDSPQVSTPASKDDLSVLGHLDGRYRTNTSGFHGVSFKKSKGLFEANIRLNGKYKYVGLYPTAQEASIARSKAIEAGGNP